MSADVSVIVSTYCAARFIEGTLRSVFAQTAPPREIIVVDDRSADETCAIVERLRAQSPVELRLIRRMTNSGGPVAPMNEGIDAARGELIAMLDHDDLMSPDRIAAIREYWDGSGRIGLTFGRSATIDEFGAPIPRDDQTYAMFPSSYTVFPARVAFDNLINLGFKYGGAGGMMFTKSMWKELGGFSDAYKIAWDFDFALRATAAGWNVGYLPQILYFHRLHSGNLEQAEGGRRLFEEVVAALRSIRSANDFDPRIERDISVAIAAKLTLAGQRFRSSGEYRTAAEYYRRALAENLWTCRAATGLCKIPFLSLRDAACRFFAARTK